MALALVREESCPVEQLRPGDLVVLPVSRRRVIVERVDRYDDEYVVRWWRHAADGEPGYRRPERFVQPGKEQLDGRYLGSFFPVHAGYVYTVAHD